MECKNFQQGRPNNNNNHDNNTNKTRGYIDFPYIQRLCKSIKTSAVSMVLTSTLKGTKQSRIYLYYIKTRTPYTIKVASSTGTEAIGWIVMVST